MTVETRNIEEWQKKLVTDLTRPIQGGLMAIGAELGGRIAPYPAAPSKSGRTWYERGYGPRWRRKDGSAGGRKTSQSLGRRWQPPRVNTRLSVVLRNSATYSALVHDSDEQTKRHAATGWQTEKTAGDEMEHDGTSNALMTEALYKGLGEKP